MIALKIKTITPEKLVEILKKAIAVEVDTRCVRYHHVNKPTESNDEFLNIVIPEEDSGDDTYQNISICFNKKDNETIVVHETDEHTSFVVSSTGEELKLLGDEEDSNDEDSNNGYTNEENHSKEYIITPLFGKKLKI